MDSSAHITDTAYLKKTLRLAKKGLGRTFPNPMVGALIVKEGKIVGSGHHHQAGLAHAEIEAIRAARGSVRGGTLYLNLEPCSFYGKTPPCVEAIIQAGISRVVCSVEDPNPKVCGNGIARLRQAGIKVSVGELSEEAIILNEAFFCFHRKRRPFISLKFAASLDGKIATASGDSKWITNQRARDFARELRGHSQAVLVGSNTVLHDDPNLGLRIPGRTDPLRIILDTTLKLPLNSQVLRDTNVLVFTTPRASRSKTAALAKRGISLFVCPGDHISLSIVMEELVRREIISVYVEGGAAILGSFVDAGLADKVHAFYGPLLIGGEKAISAIAGHGAATVNQALRLTGLSCQQLDDTVVISGYTEQFMP